MPKVSILMTSYNHERFIRESIESILTQTFKNFELIIVDDCSTDTSLSIIKSFKDKRIVAIQNKANQGPEHAFEILRKKAKGKFIAIADSDNVWEKDKLQKQVNFLEKNHSYAAVFTHVSLIDELGSPYTNTKSAYYNIFNVKNRTRQEWLRYFFYNGNCLCHPSILIRKEAYQDCNMSVNGLWQLPDLYKWIRLCLQHNIYILEEKLTNFRIHHNNISGENNLDNILRRNNELYHIYNLFYEISVQDFLLAFKEASTFMVDGQINLKFALSKLLIEHDAPAAQTLGLNKLFEMLNHAQERQQILKLYSYDNVSYKDDETKKSPYILPNWSKDIPIYHATLYLDFGDGFNEQDALTANFTTDSIGNFFVEFDNINAARKGKEPLGIRFDPCDLCAKVKLQNIVSSREKLGFEINKSILTKEQYAIYDRYDVFYTDDPSYIIHKPRKTIERLSISGKISILKPNEIAKLKDIENKIRNKIRKTTHKPLKELPVCSQNIKKIRDTIKNYKKRHD